jgi:type II restriction enzyme
MGDLNMSDTAKSLKLTDGKQLHLTPTKHNELQIAVIEKFGPRYAANATVLYLGDAAKKFVIYEQARLEQLGVPMTTHDKLPDIILYDETKGTHGNNLTSEKRCGRL